MTFAIEWRYCGNCSLWSWPTFESQRFEFRPSQSGNSGAICTSKDSNRDLRKEVNVHSCLKCKLLLSCSFRFAFTCTAPADELLLLCRLTNSISVYTPSICPSVWHAEWINILMRCNVVMFMYNVLAAISMSDLWKQKTNNDLSFRVFWLSACI